ncbi:MAG: response regulator [Symploca sp. SIO1C4]|uniref:Response regulator n=1 Tax=Symploca sp. SIO1C4 TaxID=2607765 RepID=A0A6B3NPX2_9CYAN|nr:response regulator [Symploca sp. SIO1C4]
MIHDLHSNAASRRSTAILAEDDELIRELVALYLGRLGYDVLEAKNGKEALTILDASDRGRIALLVTDLVMPEIGGAEVVKRARADEKCQRILIMSGFTEDIAFLEKTIKDGTEFLRKPFTYDDFESKIQILEGRS